MSDTEIVLTGDDALVTDLKPILDGKTFEETPIDWQGYK
jgi:hypothetical protein